MVMDALGLLMVLMFIMIGLLILVVVVLLVGRESFLAAIVFAFEFLFLPEQENIPKGEQPEIEILGWIAHSPCCWREHEEEDLQCVAPDDP